MKVLGIETSCDETSAAVIDDDRVLSSIISSQEIHSRFGGVVPELASRAHVRLITPIVRKALQSSGIDYKKLDGIAVTCGPGLVGALLVGVNFVKGLSRALNIPFIGVNHLEGHIYGNLLSQKNYQFPILFLIVSGGHTMLILMKDHLNYQVLGQTRDDAVGEAFDKGAKMLGLGYPGGPEIDRRAKNGDPDFYKFPRAWLKGQNFDFSYSGLKTALLVYLEQNPPSAISKHIDDICASYQAAAVEVLIKKTMNAAKHFGIKYVGVAGGVAANSLLREQLTEECGKQGIIMLLPEPIYCTDNAAMIARAGLEYLNSGITSGQNLNAYPNLKIKSAKKS
ncbi:MAG: tRNA (adenosine(37)-N6)-threonylcarbamoyltransferase complex transferase subunit TsaD [Calditrichaceae bacterium]|nr:tRNA (adenosine(37)-N6)-threonylcarbamoyltransferase complex transferase subunit TsaD [Calditrichaceae bacterium]MBN2708767.1 tRNA (adenosine(37)-N6)-threonylcarbamoyltransferase complex transferase subunit TsaD [Calditrichaceae bacterium]RQV97702.1 MAG: tRNA (adenosine(37)-N6)-threonylcarbamoyltransferase complex transferase subunit TsaD [Calditrichota bacterium]